METVFESSVIPSGSKTVLVPQWADQQFESSVIPSGSKTQPRQPPADR